MNLNDTTKKTIKGAFWSFFAQYSGKFFVFITTVVLAYFLSPEEYGLANYAITASTFFVLITDLGLGSALIYHEESEENLSTSFWLVLINSILLGILTWFLASFVGVYFQDERVVPILRVFSFIYPIKALMSIHDALLQKRLDFKGKFIPDVIREFSKSSISILLAVIGIGAISLVFGSLGGAIASLIAFWLITKWRPKFIFSKDSAKKMLSFGLSILIIEFLAMIALQADRWLIGRYLSVSAMGIYAIAYRIPEYLVKQISVSISKVAYPVFSSIRENHEEMKETFINTVFGITFFSFPIGVGLFIVADPLIKLIYPDEWFGIIPIMRVFSIQMALLSITYNVGNLLKANNYLREFIGMIVFRIVIIVVALWKTITMTNNLVVMSWTFLFITPIAYLFLEFILSKEKFDISMRDYFSAIKGPLLSVLLMVIVTYPVSNLVNELTNLMQLLIVTLTGIFTYGIGIRIFSPKLFSQVREYIILRKNKHRGEQ